MPQLETLISVCSGDPKVACETMTEQSDLPPESFWLSKDAEYDWFDQHAYLDHKESTNKRNSNASSSQRFPTKLVSKASIISLPMKQGSSYVDRSKRRNHRSNNCTFLPKRNESIARSMVEPLSPMVSCMGRVRSKRGRLKKTELPSPSEMRPTVKAKRSRWVGLFRRFMKSILPHRRIKSEPAAPVRMPSWNGGTSTVVREPVAVLEPPGLGGMMRFASGRRSWSEDDFDDLTWHVEK